MLANQFCLTQVVTGLAVERKISSPGTVWVIGKEHMQQNC